MLPLFILLSGLIIGLGAITVIDWHSFLGRKSKYWTEATTRTHKITKPLIWLGTLLTLVGGVWFFKEDYSGLPSVMGLIMIPMILNGMWLSFYVSPILIKKEKDGRADELLPQSLQRWTFVSFLISFFSWWSLVVLLCVELSSRL